MNEIGTNYYAVKNGPTVSEPIHIGKSSAGWLFCFQTQNNTWNEPPVIWNTFPQVKEWLKKYTVDSKDYVIMNEYDEIISFEDFVAMVERKQKDERNIRNEHNFVYARNIDGYRFSEREFS